MIDAVLFALWFFLPAGLSNGFAVVAAKLPFLRHWNTPVDGGRSWRGARILGDHKTWRGLVVGTLIGALTAWLQGMAYQEYAWVQAFCEPLDYTTVNTVLLGGLLGFGALLGDMIKSFAKRRVGVPSGKSWFPFDQIDYIAGGLLCSAIVVQLNLGVYLWIISIWFGMHLLFSYLGYIAHFKDDPI